MPGADLTLAPKSRDAAVAPKMAHPAQSKLSSYDYVDWKRIPPRLAAGNAALTYPMVSELARWVNNNCWQ